MAESTEKKVSFVERAKDFYHKYEKACKIGGALLACAGMFALGKHMASEKSELPAGDSGETKVLPQSYNELFGRDCTMTFTVDEDGTELGKVPCYESYAKEHIDSYNDFMASKAEKSEVAAE